MCKVGDRCRAQYSGDGKYYDAVVVELGGGQRYRVKYPEYKDFEEWVRGSAIKTVPGGDHSSGGSKRKEDEEKKDGGSEKVCGRSCSRQISWCATLLIDCIVR